MKQLLTYGADADAPTSHAVSGSATASAGDGNTDKRSVQAYFPHRLSWETEITQFLIKHKLSLALLLLKGFCCKFWKN